MARRRRRKLFGLKLKKNTIYTIVALLLIISSILSALSFFQHGTVLDVLYEKIYRWFGWAGMMGPVVLLSFSLFFLRLKAPIAKPNVPFGLLLIFLCFSALAQSGTAGQQIWNNFFVLLSAPGAFVVLTAMLFIGLIVLFNMSIEEIIAFFDQSLQYIGGGLGKIFPQKSKSNFLEKLPIKGPVEIRQGGLSAQAGKRKEEPEEGQGEKQARQIKVNAAPPQKTTPNDPAAIGTSLISNLPTQQQVWEYPPLSLFSPSSGQKADRGDMKQHAAIIEKTLESFGITARVVEVNLGPAVTQYALEIALGTKVSKITSLANDLALALAAPTGQIRIEAPIPGRSMVGIEIPNRSLEFVTLRHMLASDVMKKSKEKLLVALGLDVSGTPVITNISKMPHVLIAGTTGSGKSVLINTWISSLLFRTTPTEVRLILVDPKRVELTGFNGIPHLLTPVIVETDKILSALKWATQEMDRRYRLFSEVGVRNIDGYNELSGFQAIPYIIIFIDELADLMAYAPVEVEDTICRIAQMARATGIHLVVATQRPSVDVITGLLKANIPSRIAFNVSSMIDSRVIIDMPGAEKLLGRGDMLYVPPDQAKPTRIQGTYVSEHEVNSLVKFLKNSNVPVEYTQEVTSMPKTWKKSSNGIQGTTHDDGKDALFEQAVRVVCQYDRASASLLQRRLSIGYARAARIIDQLEADGIIGQGEGAKPRDVLVKNPDEFFANRQGEAATSSAQ